MRSFHHHTQRPWVDQPPQDAMAKRPPQLSRLSVRGCGTTIALAFSEDSLRERPFEWAKPPDRMAERAKKFAEKQAGGAG